MKETQEILKSIYKEFDSENFKIKQVNPERIKELENIINRQKKEKLFSSNFCKNVLNYLNYKLTEETGEIKRKSLFARQIIFQDELRFSRIQREPRHWTFSRWRVLSADFFPLLFLLLAYLLRFFQHTPY